MFIDSVDLRYQTKYTWIDQTSSLVNKKKVNKNNLMYFRITYEKKYIIMYFKNIISDL
jgi:hypothetical protein